VDNGSEEESRSPQTLDLAFVDDESLSLKIFIKEKTIDFKIKLNLTNVVLTKVFNDSESAETKAKANSFIKKLFIGLEAGTGNPVVDFFSIVLDGKKGEGEMEGDLAAEEYYDDNPALRPKLEAR
jgi:hypothetical protein